MDAQRGSAAALDTEAPWSWRRGLLAWLGYVLVTALCLAPLLPVLTTHILADDAFIRPGQSDAYNFLWGYWWMQKAALSEHAFFYCDWIFPPEGVNIFFHTHVLLPSLLTLPLARALGVVAGYNLMIIAMLASACAVYRAMLRRTFELDELTSSVCGALFGLSPYFLFKAHAHVNLIGGFLWAGALALLVHAYLRGRWGVRWGVLFALCFWGCYFTSLVEWFMLVVIAAAVVMTFELFGALSGRAGARGPGWRARLSFALPVALGAASLRSLSVAPAAETVSVKLYRALTLRDLLAFPRLSALADVYASSVYEFWGSSIPIVVVLLCVLAGQRSWRRRELWPMAALALGAMFLTMDVLGVPSAVLRALPYGAGFRVFARFLPFVLFFAVAVAAHGLARLLRMPRSAARTGILGLLALCWLLEVYPAKLNPSPVDQLHTRANAEAIARLDRARSILVVPKGRYLNHIDAWQVLLDMPFVYLSYRARHEPALDRQRRRRYPRIYVHSRSSLFTRAWRREAAELGVGYVLCEARSQCEGLRSGRELINFGESVLIELDAGS
jgi:hypothetical protein